MLENIMSSVIGDQLTTGTYLICTAFSLVLGLLTALSFGFKNRQSKTFTLALLLLPAVVQTVILLVNGNLGAGVAVAGAFSLVRFRSAPGSAKEIAAIFLAMTVGLATGMGYLAIACMITVIVCAVMLLFNFFGFGEGRKGEREMKITIPEDLDYTSVFDDLFEKYTSASTLDKVKTSGLGSLYKLEYTIVLKDEKKEKEFIDDLRCRNGNLEIVCGRVTHKAEEL